MIVCEYISAWVTRDQWYPQVWDIGLPIPMGPSSRPSWIILFYGQFHEGRPLYIHTCIMVFLLVIFLHCLHILICSGKKTGYNFPLLTILDICFHYYTFVDFRIYFPSLFYLDTYLRARYETAPPNMRMHVTLSCLE